MKGPEKDRRAGAALTNKTCGRVGCKNKITTVAVRHADPYCSRACCEADVAAAAAFESESAA